VQYESLKAGLELLDSSSHEFQVIDKYMKSTEPQWRKLKLQHVWRVHRDKVVRGGGGGGRGVGG
jgi:3-deoxy-D-manno-octulosonic acid (KDO) 8-phosphate synthase